MNSNKIAIISIGFIVALQLIYACTKDKGINPDLAFKDNALLDSCKNQEAFSYYKNDANTIYPGNNNSHGAFKLKFNKIALQELTDNGKLPIGSKFPNGSMIVKEVYSGTNINFYALMYKRNGSWIWAEIEVGGKVLFSVEKDPGLCISCHQQSGNRDLVDTFIFY